MKMKGENTVSGLESDLSQQSIEDPDPMGLEGQGGQQGHDPHPGREVAKERVILQAWRRKLMS